MSTEIPDISRRRFLRNAALGAGGLAFAPMILSACGDNSTAGSSAPGSGAGSGAGAMKTVSAQLSWQKNVEWAGMWLAETQGIYTQQGITPVWLPGGPNAPTAESVVLGGTADIGITTNIETIVDAMIADPNLVMYAAQYQRTPLSLISLPKNPVHTAKDLIGKRIGGVPETQRSVQIMLDVAGIKGDYTFIPIGFDPQPLMEGDADVVFGFATSQGLIVKERGHDPVIRSLSEMGMPGYANTFFSTRDHLATNREAIVNFLRATVMGFEINEKDPKVAVDLTLASYGADLGLSADQQFKENSTQIPLMQSDFTNKHGLFRVDANLMENEVYSWLKVSGRKNLPDLSKVFDPTIMDDVFKGKTRLT